MEERWGERKDCAPVRVCVCVCVLCDAFIVVRE